MKRSDEFYRTLFDDPEAFFTLDGSVTMRLSRIAAMRVCEMAAGRGFVVAGIEGGIWHRPGIEARIDCIWSGAGPPLSQEEAERNNQRARTFIEDSAAIHDAFILTAPPITGWKHKQIRT